jgi:hypothetical protein
MGVHRVPPERLHRDRVERVAKQLDGGPMLSGRMDDSYPKNRFH